MNDRPFAYVCSRYRGDVEANTQRAKDYCKKVFEAGYTPIAPHLYFPQFLNENKPEERSAGLEMAASMIPICHTLVICDEEISEGMKSEIELAKKLQIPVCQIDEFPIAPPGYTLSQQLELVAVNAVEIGRNETTGGNYFVSIAEACEGILPQNVAHQFQDKILDYMYEHEAVADIEFSDDGDFDICFNLAYCPNYEPWESETEEYGEDWPEQEIPNTNHSVLLRLQEAKKAVAEKTAISDKQSKPSKGGPEL